MFRNKYKLDDSVIHYTEAGTPVVPVFLLDEDKNAVVEVGKNNIVEEINSYADSVDLNVIKKQLICGNQTIAEAFNGGMFSAGNEKFGDATISPKTFTEYQRNMREAYNQYNSLPEEVRAKFDSIDDFIGADNDTIKAISDMLNPVKDEQLDNVGEESVNNAE